MSRLRSVVLTLSTALAVGGAISASAYAGQVWVVNGSVLKTSETSTVNAKFGKLKITWENKSTKFEAECIQTSGEVELKGGSPGTDKLKALTFEGCALVKGGSGCKITVGGVTAEELPGWPTELQGTSGKAYDVANGIKFSLILEKCAEVSFSKSWLFAGDLKAEVSTGSGKVKALYPATELEGDSLKVEGAKALLSGEGDFEKEGGTLWFENEVKAGFIVEGKEIKDEEEVPFTSEGASPFWQGGGLKVKCAHETSEGDFLAEGRSVLTSDFSECVVEEPSHCAVAESIIFGTGGLIKTFEGKLADAFSPETGTIFTELKLSSSGGTCSLAGSVPITGTAQALIDNETETVEHTLTFNASSGSELEVAGSTATFKVKDKVKLSSGFLGEKWSVQ